MIKNYKLSGPYLDNKEINAVTKTLKSGWISYGKKSIYLEKSIAKKLRVKHVISVNSCTSGIIAALIANGAKKGDEVITPANTFVSTINSLYNLGLKIKLCDINKYTLSSDLIELKKVCSKKTKFFLPVHFGGNPLDIKKIINFCNSKKIKVIDDAATALGAKINKKFIGSFDDCTTVFSLHANKIITSGEGGLVCTNKKKIAVRIKKIVNSGLVKDSWERHNKKQFSIVNSIYPGHKFNYNDILASIAVEQLKKINKIISYRKRLSELYTKNLSELFEKKIIYLPEINNNSESSYYCYQIIFVKENKKNRNNLANFLMKKKISTSLYYTPAHKHTYYKKYFKIPSNILPNTNHVFNNSLALPLHNNLTFQDINFISKTILLYFKNDQK